MARSTDETQIDALDARIVEILDELAVTTLDRIRGHVSRVPSPAKDELNVLLSSSGKIADCLPQKVCVALALDLGIEDKEVLETISENVVLGSVHSDILDDIVDTKGEKWPFRDFYLTHILFNFYVDSWERLRNISRTQTHFASFLEAEIETYSALFEEELHHVGTPNIYESTDLVAQKCAPLKCVIREILKIFGRTDIEETVFKLVEQGALAVLLLDDILDWEEDFDRCRFTYPLQKALERAQISYRKEEHAAIKLKVFRTIACTELYNELVGNIINILDSCLDDARAISPTLAYWLNEYKNKATRAWQHHLKTLVAITDFPTLGAIAKSSGEVRR